MNSLKAYFFTQDHCFYQTKQSQKDIDIIYSDYDTRYTRSAF